MGDKSPKSKKRDQNQHSAAKQAKSADLQAKQDGQNRGLKPLAPKGKK